jgi:hypothetical protein
VFTTAIGTPTDPSNLRRTISDLANLADIGHLAPNQLRPSVAPLLFEARVPLQQVADMLSRKDIRLMAQSYRHTIQSVVDVTGGQARMLLGYPLARDRDYCPSPALSPFSDCSPGFVPC